ncbi:hypothetical protein Cadr_000002913 [Camelus dromedarius]|uniref:Uncharacterized protein n=1 Tax=Camelus dromedarius TaxID=9838 RepID=A0A5N4C483_CAMDR|nr:hypothetical protein Cadr_000002913 [Camelus dromedarius]
MGRGPDSVRGGLGTAERRARGGRNVSPRDFQAVVQAVWEEEEVLEGAQPIENYFWNVQPIEEEDEVEEEEVENDEEMDEEEVDDEEDEMDEEEDDYERDEESEEYEEEEEDSDEEEDAGYVDEEEEEDDPYHQFAEEPLLKWIVRVTNLAAVSLVLNASERKTMFGLIQDPQIIIEQSRMVLCDPDTQEVGYSLRNN